MRRIVSIVLMVLLVVALSGCTAFNGTTEISSTDPVLGTWVGHEYVNGAYGAIPYDMTMTFYDNGTWKSGNDELQWAKRPGAYYPYSLTTGHYSFRLKDNDTLILNADGTLTTFTRYTPVEAIGSATGVPAPEAAWNRTYGRSGDDVGYCVIQTADAGYAIAGYTELIGNDSREAYLVKTDADGNMLWDRAFGGGENYTGMSLVQANDGGYIIAGFEESRDYIASSIYLTKTDPDGNVVWNRTYGGRVGHGNSIIPAGDGGFIVVGNDRMAGNIQAGRWSPECPCLIKIDASGNLLWEKLYGQSDGETGDSVARDRDGGYIITGTTTQSGICLIKTDSEGNMLWNRTFRGEASSEGRSVIQASDGGYVVSGSMYVYKNIYDPSPICYIYLLKTDDRGNKVWQKYIGGKGYAGGFSVIQASDGGFAIAGGMMDSHSDDGYLIKTDARGNVAWSYSRPGFISGMSILQAGDGGYVVAGFGDPDGSTDVYLLKTNAESTADISHPGLAPSP